MNVKEREAGDGLRLEALVDTEPNAKRRDRYRMALLALRGWEANDIAEALASSRRTVQEWAYRYRDGGIDALVPRQPKGNTPRLTPEQQQTLRQRVIDGPRESDGVCTLRGATVRDILQNEFGVAYKLSSVYALMHRLGLSCLKPRPRHEQSDPEAMRVFKEESAPLLFRRRKRRSSRAAAACA